MIIILFSFEYIIMFCLVFFSKLMVNILIIDDIANDNDDDY